MTSAATSPAPPPLDSAGCAPSAEFLELIPRDFARRHLIVSAGFDGCSEDLLVSATTSPAAIHNVGARLHRGVETRVGDGESIARIIDRVYASSATDARHRSEVEALVEIKMDEKCLQELLKLSERDLLSTQGKAPVIRLVDGLIFEALQNRASDIHVQPLADRTLIRYRVDGVLHTVRELPTALTAPIVSRIKVMGRMDIAERRVPQDGRATVTIGQRSLTLHDSLHPNGHIDGSANSSGGGGSGGRSIDLRISTLPTSYGERAVIRLLDNDAGDRLTTFESLGMPKDVLSQFLDRAGRTSGIVLVTGPTGSGKTTTLYTTLRWIAQRGGGDLNVMTIEDPIEYELSTVGVAISQAQVNRKKGVTFASGLRHILRQDPDVVMVGEIRDAETARTAIQASLTGHLVFSTLHTNDAPSAVTRLVDLGIEPYLVSASLSAVLAQRLVRRAHQSCSGSGCELCFGTGLLGRLGLFELLVVDGPIRELISKSATAQQLSQVARKRGMRCLRDEGTRLVREGITTQLEVDRVAWGIEDEAPAAPVTQLQPGVE